MNAADLKRKLTYDISKINEKLCSDEYIDNYRKARLQGMRTKAKEILKLLEEK